MSADGIVQLMFHDSPQKNQRINYKSDPRMMIDTSIRFYMLFNRLAMGEWHINTMHFSLVSLRATFGSSLSMITLCDDLVCHYLNNER